MADLKLVQHPRQDIFRAYDIRGIVPEAIDANVAYTLGRSIGSEAVERGIHRLVCGRDGRISSPELFEALTTGLIEAGLELIDVGMVPTPVLYFACFHFETYSGVMLTGSHNPADYNGIKIMLNRNTLREDDIQKLYQRIRHHDWIEGEGKLIKKPIIPAYIQQITSDVKLKRKLKVVIDCGNGVAGIVAPELFKALGCEVIELFCEVDGRFPNHHPDPTIEKNLKVLIDTVKKNQADIGLAFDGDADRLGMVTDKGAVIWPDRQMVLFARDVISRNPGCEIIFDVKCSKHLADEIARAGGKPLMWKTGHSIVKAKMQERNALLAGEMSGHIFFKERWFGFDDGLYTGCRLLEIISKQDKSVTDLFETVPNSINTPELKVPLAEDKKKLFMENFAQQAKFDSAQINRIDGLRADFSFGWGLVRMSNTTPCLTVRFEADTEANLKKIQNEFRAQMLAIDNSLDIPF